MNWTFKINGLSTLFVLDNINFKIYFPYWLLLYHCFITAKIYKRIKESLDWSFDFFLEGNIFMKLHGILHLLGYN